MKTNIQLYKICGDLTRDIHPMMVCCWATVRDAGSATNQHGAEYWGTRTGRVACDFTWIKRRVPAGRRRHCEPRWRLQPNGDNCLLFKYTDTAFWPSIAVRSHCTLGLRCYLATIARLSPPSLRIQSSYIHTLSPQLTPDSGFDLLPPGQDLTCYWTPVTYTHPAISDPHLHTRITIRIAVVTQGFHMD